VGSLGQTRTSTCADPGLTGFRHRMQDMAFERGAAWGDPGLLPHLADDLLNCPTFVGLPTESGPFHTSSLRVDGSYTLALVASGSVQRARRTYVAVPTSLPTALPRPIRWVPAVVGAEPHVRVR